MKTLFKLLLLGLIIFSQDALAQKTKKAFNGKNFKGWVVPTPNYDNWTIENGILHVKSSDDKKGSILWTDKDYTDFIIEAEYKNVSGVVDTGIFLRSELNQIQMGISGSLKKDVTGSPYIIGKGYPVFSKIDGVLKPDDWNHIKVKLVDKTYTVWLNGEEVMTYTTEEIPASGPIGLQLHPGNTMAVDYRNIKLAEL
ncbi:3-keto-disaccharide hydrolase [Jiulongibacter sp. NS-SX5]|uniref:3-keto-disaccharide hydrolase n=1 Tax=Jiulongibacter sp. NS-SX5 TaxID=3463854 RepID=UPI004059AE06